MSGGSGINRGDGELRAKGMEWGGISREVKIPCHHEIVRCRVMLMNLFR